MKTGVKSTNVELDRALLKKAMEALEGKTIRETIEEGLRRIVAEKSLRELSAYMASRTPQERAELYDVRDSAW